MIKAFVTISICFLSCTNFTTKKELQQTITVDCYWDIIDDGVINLINSCYKFNKDGSCSFYYYNFYNKVRTDSVFHFDDGDVVVPNFWRIKNDTVIDIRGIKFSLIKYSEDSVFLKNLINRGTLILAKNCRTFHNKSLQ